MYAYRFTDTHVRKHPALIAIAIEYAHAYCGEFEPMLEAQEAIRRTGTLPVAQARKVLNILRQELDPDVTSLQIEALSVLEETKAEIEAESRRSEFKVVPPPRPQPKRERPYRIETAVRVHKPYVMPRVASGSIHIVDWAECRWSLPDSWEARKINPSLRGIRTPKIVVHYTCGNYTDSRIIFLDEPEAPERRLCVKCFPPCGVDR